MPRWLWSLVALVVLFSLVETGSSFVTDAWWFASLGFGSVFRRVVGLQVAAGLVAVVVSLVVVGGSARLAARAGRTPRPPLRPAGEAWDRVRGDPMRVATTLATLVVAAASGLAAARSWPLVGQALYGAAFGATDPVFGNEVAFYVFQLPLAMRVVGWLAGLSVAAAVVSLAHYVGAGTVRVQLVQQDGQLVVTGLVLPREVRRHLASLAAALLALFAVMSWLERYTLMSARGESIAGPGYADLHVTLPLLLVQGLGAVGAAVLAVVAVDRGSLRGLAGAAGLVLGLRVLTAAIPAAVQRFVVEPSELSREAPQIEHHLTATRASWNLDAVRLETLSGAGKLDWEAIEANEATLGNIALWDHAPLLQAVSQLQEIRTYYRFVSVDQDRYPIGGQLRQVVIAGREIDVEGLAEEARTWVNRTMTYTHGYGVVVTSANEVTPQGLPELLVRDVPPRPTTDAASALAVTRPELYFGELVRGPVVVRTTNEFDYARSEEEKQYNEYEGADGIPLHSLWRRLVFSVRMSSSALLLSSDVRPDSRVLLYRHIRDRVSRLAPMFRYDSDPYLVIDQGRLVWMLDALSVSDRYPYAAHFRGLGSYARNAVKVTIDAYDGTVHFYRLDVADPIADTWGRVFPDLFEPISNMPASLRAHLRYPQDLFAAQAELMATYHMEEAQPFYMREDAWQVPVLGAARNPAAMVPFYTMMSLPGAERAQAEFLLMLPFSPVQKRNLKAWMVARSDGEHYGELIVYQFPRDGVFGPGNVDARIEQDAEISEKKTLWGQQGSEVLLGPLLAIPVDESIIYVRALYLAQADASTALPELKRVIVAYEDRIAMGQTLDEGLAKLFGSRPEAAPVPPTAPGAAAMSATRGELIRQASLHWRAAEGAARAGDWSQFGVHMEQLGEAMRTLESTAGP
jgi:uncharacterized protein